MSAGFWLLLAVAAAGTASLVRVLITAVLIVAGQWLTTRLAAPPVVWAVAFGLPALLAGTSVARLLGVTDTVRSSGGRR